MGWNNPYNRVVRLEVIVTIVIVSWLISPYLGDEINLLILGWNLPVTKYHGHPSRDDEQSKGCFSSPAKRKVFRFHAPILSFGEPGSLGIKGQRGLVYPSSHSHGSERWAPGRCVEGLLPWASPLPWLWEEGYCHWKTRKNNYLESQVP